MGTWILFIVMSVYGGASVTTQEFTTRAACEQSAKITWDRFQKLDYMYGIRDVYCLPKYVKDK